MRSSPTPSAASRRRDRAMLTGFNWVVSSFVIGMFALLLLGLLA